MGSHPFICCEWWIPPPFHLSLISGSISSIKVQNNSSKFSNFRIIHGVCESVVSKSISSNLVCCLPGSSIVTFPRYSRRERFEQNQSRSQTLQYTQYNTSIVMLSIWSGASLKSLDGIILFVTQQHQLHPWHTVLLR